MIHTCTVYPVVYICSVYWCVYLQCTYSLANGYDPLTLLFFTFCGVSFQYNSRTQHKKLDIIRFSANQQIFFAFLEVLRGILCILELLHGILYIFGSSSWDFVHFWKFLVGFCAFFEVPHGILCIFVNSTWQSIHVSRTLTGLMRRRRIIAFVWRRCPSLGLSQIIFMIWYDFSHIFYFNNFYCK